MAYVCREDLRRFRPKVCVDDNVLHHIQITSRRIHWSGRRGRGRGLGAGVRQHAARDKYRQSHGGRCNGGAVFNLALGSAPGWRGLDDKTPRRADDDVACPLSNRSAGPQHHVEHALPRIFAPRLILEDCKFAVQQVTNKTNKHTQHATPQEAIGSCRSCCHCARARRCACRP